MGTKSESRTVTALHHESHRERQPYGTVVSVPIALDASIRGASIENLNQVLVDTMTLRDLYKKHHWQVSGPTFYQLHLLFDKHFDGQSELVDAVGERIQSLGGVSIAMPHDVAEMTRDPTPAPGPGRSSRADRATAPCP
jgi:starvation-inducible DNA-binding protein